MPDMTPHELLEESYPSARRCIEPLSELLRNNKGLEILVLELAVVIGINAAHQRLEDDKRFTINEQVRQLFGQSPSW